jgi:hypothetical protein
MPQTTLYSPVPDQWKLDPALAAKADKQVKFSSGKVIGIVDNGKLKKFGDALEWHLRARGARDVVRWSKHYQEGPPEDALIAEIASKVEVAVVGLGN